MEVPDDIVYSHIFPFLDVRSVFVLASTSKENRQHVQTYMEKTGRTRLLKWMVEQKLQKEKFFYDHLAKISLDTLLDLGHVKLFFYLDDMYHRTDFAKRVLRLDGIHNNIFSDTDCTSHSNCSEEWTYHHTSFYDDCLQEIQSVYDSHCSNLKKKYNLMVK